MYDRIQEETKKREEYNSVFQPKGLITERKKIMEDDLGFCLDEDSGDSQDNFLYNEKENS